MGSCLMDVSVDQAGRARELKFLFASCQAEKNMWKFLSWGREKNISRFRQRLWESAAVWACTHGTFHLALLFTTISIFPVLGLLSILCAVQGLRSVTRTSRYSRYSVPFSHWCSNKLCKAKTEFATRGTKSRAEIPLLTSTCCGTECEQPCFVIWFPFLTTFLTWLYRKKSPGGIGCLLPYEMLCRTSAKTCRLA